MENITLGGISSWIGLICLWIFVIWQLIDWRKRKKERTFKYISKDSWWQRTYIWQVFFRRTQYRPIASTFPWLIFIVPSLIMIWGYIIVLSEKPSLKLNEMHQVSGIVSKVHIGQGKGSYDYIRVKDDYGHEENYRLSRRFLNNEEFDEFKQSIQDTKTRIKLWYKHEKGIFSNYKVLWELRVNDKNITLNNRIKFKYDYEWFVQRDKNALPNLLWWINYSLIGWIWLWILNRKELPIHRLNKRKFYKKYNLKDE